ncbi:hypothetical protein CC86DRAFT_423097 [Ophiobolus disseminans]|uniref:BTB domain-containing protein n=1 Tax=Ophiobolus disseminans TaxID=1469910 RepID=A0A6A6ZQG0_9PLEO|nr:hypothetical protein CC86DRAFT_423097 [Ophiobolus disseminans]
MADLGSEYKVDGLENLVTAKFRRAAALFVDKPEFAHAMAKILVRDGELSKEIRAVIVDTVAGHPDLIGNETINGVLKSDASFAYHVLMKMRNISMRRRRGRWSTVNDPEMLLLSGIYSDLAITCGDFMYRVHKAIVYTRCKFPLRLSLQNTDVEAMPGSTLNLPDEDPMIIGLLIQILYTGGYSSSEIQPWFPYTCRGNCNTELSLHCICDPFRHDDCTNDMCSMCVIERLYNPSESAAKLLRHAKLYQIAIKYNLPDLADLSSSKFRHACSLYWEHE